MTMYRAICLSIDSLVDSKLEHILFNVAVPLILVIKNKTQFSIARSMLKEKLEELSSKHPSFYYSLEALSTVLDIDYNLLLDLYEYLAYNYVSRVDYAEELLRVLRSKNIRSIVYTKSDSSIEEIKLSAVGIRTYVDLLISLPELFGVVRGSDVFRKLANHVVKQGHASNAKEILVVSPNLEDYLDAREAGLNVIWFSKHGEVRTRNQIFSLRELLDLI